MTKKTFFPPLIFFLFFIFIYHKAVDGFYLYKTKPTTLFKTKTTPFIRSHLPLSDITTLLSQPFYYLDSGSQCFVFISEDKKIILKILKHPTWTPFFENFDLFFLKQYKTSWIENKQNSLDSTFKSLLHCLTTFQNESEILYASINSNPLQTKTIQVYDQIKQKHIIPLHNCCLILQKAGLSFNEVFSTLHEQKKTEKAKALLDALFTMIQYKRSLGFIDKDSNIIKNFGFINDKPILLDIGGFMQTDNPLQYQKEIKKIKKTLLPWIETHYPELFNHTFDLIEQTNLIVYKKQTKNIEKKASSFYYEENFF